MHTPIKDLHKSYLKKNLGKSNISILIDERNNIE